MGKEGERGEEREKKEEEKEKRKRMRKGQRKKKKGTEGQADLQALNVFYLVFCRERLLTLVGQGPILYTFWKSHPKPFWCTSM